MRISVQKWLVVGSLAAALAAIVLVTAPRIASGQGDGGKVKNIKSALFKGKSKDEIKKYMKEKISKGLNVQCDFCHDLEDMSIDTPKKKKAREMADMVHLINTKYMKKKELVSCATCHRGKEKPDK